MSLPLTRQSLSDPEQHQLKKCVTQSLADSTIRFARGVQHGNDYFMFVATSRLLKCLRFGWRTVLQLMPLRNFPVRYIKHHYIRKENIRPVWEENFTGTEVAFDQRILQFQEAHNREGMLELPTLYFDGKSFEESVKNAHRLMQSIEDGVCLPQDLQCVLEHRADDIRILKMSFRLELRPRTFLAHYIAIGKQCKLLLWDKSDTAPDISQLKFKHINSQVVVAMNQLRVLKRLHSFRREMETLLPIFKLEEAEEERSYLLGHWRNSNSRVSLLGKLADECVELSTSIRVGEKQLESKMEFVCPQAMAAFLRKQFELYTDTFAKFREKLRPYLNTPRFEVIENRRSMRCGSQEFEVEELMVMGAFSPPLCFVIAYSPKTNKYSIKSQVGHHTGVAADEIGQYFSEDVIEYELAEERTTPPQLQNAQAIVKQWTSSQQLDLIIEVDLQPFDMLYLFDRDIKRRAMYLKGREVVIATKTSNRTVVLQSVRIEEDFLKGDQRMLVVRTAKPTSIQQEAIIAKVHSNPPILNDCQLEGAMSWLRWNIPPHKLLSDDFHRTIVKVTQACH